MVRCLPVGSPKWHPTRDHLAGTDVYGNPADNSMAWGIKFDNIPYTQLAFATLDLSNYIIALKEVILGSFYNIVYLNFLRTSLSPDAEGMSAGNHN